MTGFWSRKKTILSGLLGVFVVGTVLLAGCSDSDATGKENSIAADLAKEQAASTKPLSEARNTPAVRVAKSVGPAVVGITNKAVVRDWFNMPVEKEGVGSGVIFRSDGYVVTNNHVVQGAKEITVSLADGRTFKGKLIGADELTDIAVVKVEATGLPTAKFGNSDDLVVGEPAIAIGNPLGLEFQGSVTAGVISALNRTLDISERRLKLIQTDAAISPGNSGGALVNADGEVIGINSAKIAASGVEGIAFSIPINTVQEVIDQLLKHGYVVRPYLGVGIFDKQTAARAGYTLNADKGVYVEHMELNGPAYQAGIERGDLILKIDGTETNTVADLRAAVADHKVGDKVQIVIERNGKKQTVTATLQEMPQDNR
ncbi:trypsin-like peptidase domain-containing protein [Selenomonas sputigena]|uniref:Trypsin-like peptidase domain-containing protein n=1 Tax=Selenomonas sputigena TaxID=69823 RepID=A0ABV3X570_9FIRM